ncbi:MAG TPA: SemiSWEET transporter [Alphaproteobacteria bacterium]|jgi:MtN3 and saliva related transmembrane protein
MPLATFIGLAAAVLTTSSFMPQVVKAWRTRSTRDLSLGMYLVFAAGSLLWLIYGLMTGQLPVILANGITFLLVAVILYCIWRNRAA